MARDYKWTIPMKSLVVLTEETGRSWFSSAEISEKAEVLCRWEVSQRAVAVAMRRWMTKGRVEGRKVRQQTFSQAHVEIWEWKVKV